MPSQFVFAFFVSAFTLANVTQAIPFQLIVNVPASTPSGSELFITSGENGNFLPQCAGKPDCVRLTQVQDFSYYAEVEAPTRKSNFKVRITRGNWGAQAAGADGGAIGDIQVDGPILSVVNWTDLSALGVTGTVIKLSKFYSPQLDNERDISIWLPPSYFSAPQKRYPVIYLHDGQNVFDPQTSTWGVDWGADETMTRLIAEGSVPEAILVAADCTDDREAEYDWSKKGPLYADFLIQTLKPKIDAEYRTFTDRQSTFLMGSSMGALISTTILWFHPETFSAAAGLSLAAHYEDGSLFRILENTPVPAETRLYSDCGDTGFDQPYEPWLNRWYGFLKGKNFPSFLLKKFAYADHNEAAWSRRVSVPLKFLLAP